jgi:hypothetical protein
MRRTAILFNSRHGGHLGERVEVLESGQRRVVIGCNQVRDMGRRDSAEGGEKKVLAFLKSGKTKTEKEEMVK